MDQAGITPELQVNIQVSGRTLVISSTAASMTVDQEAMDRVFTAHEEALRRLSKGTRP